jgi:hypothetical protein
MPFTINDILYGGAVPVIVAVTTLFVFRYLLPLAYSVRASASMATLSGFLVGYGLLKLAPWAPEAHWHWLPYLLIASAIVGPVACAVGVNHVERLLLYLLVAVVAAWFLVPTWEDLDPSRTIHCVVFVAYVVVLASLLEPLAIRLLGPLLPIVFWATMTTAAVVLALSGSLRFAQIALAGAGSLFGVLLVACFRRETNHVTGLALLFSVMAVGLMLVGRVNSFSEVPLASYLLVPAAPLSLWLGVTGPLTQMTRGKRMVVSLILPFALLGGALLLAAMAEMNSGSEW